MFLFDLLFGRKKENTEAAPAQVVVPAGAAAHTADAPGTTIHHDPHLIERLMGDHQVLLDIFGAISEASKSGDLVEAQKQLEHFRTTIMDHLLKENVRLYIYLEHLLANDAVAHELMHGFRREMDAIGKVVVGFLSKYKSLASHPELAAEFSRDLTAIGEALVARIRREEETLYPMYEAPEG
jgi:regulator of sigma D